MLVVQKYSGKTLDGTDESIRNIARNIAAKHDEGCDLVVVISSRREEKHTIIDRAFRINPAVKKRELDMMLCCCEQITASLVASTLDAMGYPAVSIAGWQYGVLTDSSHTNAKVKTVTAQRINEELDRKNIVIIAGYQGLNKDNDITTLGRGGSDTLAVAIAAAIKADYCQMFTVRDGIFTADPDIVPNARRVEEISFDEMYELMTNEENIIHIRAVELAHKYYVNLELLSAFDSNGGTRIREMSEMEKKVVTSITKDTNIARVALIGVPDTPGIAFKIFSMLSKKNINVDIILQAMGRENTQDISFTVSKDSLEEARAIIEEKMPFLGAKKLSIETNVAKISVVGAGMAQSSGVAANVFEAMFDADVNIEMISTSEIKISMLVKAEDCEKALNAIHDKFMLHKNI